ncbi:MAG: cytochrome b/b6 domain-containing protein [Rubrivivax sp.]
MADPAWVHVWPAWQRLLHAVLALAVLTALATHEGGTVHEWAGYAAGVAALLRAGLGAGGPRSARLSAFVRGPAATWAYARRVWQGRAERHLNHNPLGAWMVLLLLALAAGAAASGALYVTDRFWGEAWVIGAHAWLGWPLLAAVPLHVAGVWHAGRQQRENLALAMLTGRKPSRPGDLD